MGLVKQILAISFLVFSFVSWGQDDTIDLSLNADRLYKQLYKKTAEGKHVLKTVKDVKVEYIKDAFMRVAMDRLEEIIIENLILWLRTITASGNGDVIYLDGMAKLIPVFGSGEHQNATLFQKPKQDLGLAKQILRENFRFETNAGGWQTGTTWDLTKVNEMDVYTGEDFRNEQSLQTSRQLIDLMKSAFIERKKLEAELKVYREQEELLDKDILYMTPRGEEEIIYSNPVGENSGDYSALAVRGVTESILHENKLCKDDCTNKSHT